MLLVFFAGNMMDEEAVSRAAFDLIFAFDEVISHGHKENITVQQVKCRPCIWSNAVLAVCVVEQHSQSSTAPHFSAVKQCRGWLTECR